MLNEYEREQIRRAYYLEKQSIYRIAKDLGYSHQAVEKAIFDPLPKTYQLSRPKPAPVFGPYQPRVEALLQQNEQMPRKQHYTAHKIFEILRTEGYQGSESHLRGYLAQRKKQAHHAQEVFLPLEFEPGQDAQVDWGEAIVLLDGQRQKVQFFLMRLSYSRRAFAVAFPSQAQECFLSAHMLAFKHFGGVPHRISYDNLGTAVKIEPTRKRGRPRQEVEAFVRFRSYYLFDSHFCTPGLSGAHEKGGVEQSVGYTRRQFMVPLPDATSFDDLNRQFLVRALQEDDRRVARESQTIGEAWEQERDLLVPLPSSDYECCEMTTARVTPYAQATFKTNRYSLPVERACKTVTLKAYPFTIEIWDGADLLASHPRCYEHEQDVFDPHHYLPLLERKPGAFDFAKPIRQWKAEWPESYHQMLRILRETWPGGRGIQEFVRVLMLHQRHPAEQVERAIEQALAYGCVHLDGVVSCLTRELEAATQPASPPRDATDSLEHALRPDLAAMGNQPVDLSRYEQLLKLSW